MKKKQYIIPEMEITKIQNMSLLAGSVDANGDVIIGDAPEPDNEEIIDAATRGFDFDFDDFKQILLLFIFTLTSLFASAQTIETQNPANAPADGKKHAMKLYLKTGGTIEYNTKSTIDRVTYLPDIGMKVYIKGETESVDYLYSQMNKIEYTIENSNNTNANWSDGVKGNDMWTTESFKEAWRLEYPQLNAGTEATGSTTNSQVVVKTCSPYGITYSVEWDNSLIANRWTCYELHAGNSASNVKRKDDFKADPEVAVSSVLDDYKNSGFARGHLCPSADRLCSTEQNKQTFFLTNMQPQYTSHNSGLWSRLEDQVRSFATNDTYTNLHCDTLYIVKAATITDKVTIGGEEVDGVYFNNEHTAHQLCNDRLLVPKYFYMALLHYNKDTDSYHALAFWTDHISTTQPVANLGDYAISIEELEKRTGIDFFCNLPDDIESEVEKTLELDFWHLTTTP